MMQPSTFQAVLDPGHADRPLVQVNFCTNTRACAHEGRADRWTANCVRANTAVESAVVDSKASAASTTGLFAEQPRQSASEANCLALPRNLFGWKVGLLPKFVIVGLLKFVGSLPHLLYETAKLLSMPRRMPMRSCRRHCGAANRGSLSHPVSAVSPIRRNCPSVRRSCRPRTAQSAFRGQ
jgi:hypothetical protein